MKRTSLPLHRRTFIAALGGAAAWPLVARAQQAEPMRRLMLTSSDQTIRGASTDQVASSKRFAVRVNGRRDLKIETRHELGLIDSLRDYAAELVHSRRT